MSKKDVHKNDFELYKVLNERDSETINKLYGIIQRKWAVIDGIEKRIEGRRLKMLEWRQKIRRFDGT